MKVGPRVRTAASATALSTVAAIALLAAEGNAVHRAIPFVGIGSSLSTPAPAPGQFLVSGAVRGLYPGDQHGSLILTVQNPNPVPIDVTSITVTAQDASQVCTASNLKITNFSGSLTVGAKSSVQQALPATLAITTPNGCQGAVWPLTYGGTANGSSVPTSIVLSAAPNPSSFMQSVTFAATVTGGAGSNGVPTGTVTFYDGSMSLGTQNLDGSGIARLTTSSLSVGSHQITATYGGDGTFFSPGGPSNIVNEQVQACVTPPTSNATTILTGTSGAIEVHAGKSTWLDGGTINGNVTVDSRGQFSATGGSISGSIASSGTAVSLMGTSVSGNVQSSAGGLALGPGTTVRGNVQPSGGGPFCSDGQSLVQSPVVIGGNLQPQSLSATNPVSSICATSVGKDLVWQSNAAPVLLGVCGANRVGGNLGVQSNSGRVAIGSSGAGNTVSGNIQVQKNTGGGSMSYNSAGGICQLQNDAPPISGSVTNTAGGKTNTCTASG